MLIPNKFITLDYDPSTDILFIEWPNIHDYSLAELKFILDELVTTIKNYDIKKVLADSTKSIVTMPDEEYNAVLKQLALDLLSTRLEKFARLTTGQGYREEAVANGVTVVGDQFAIQNFEALPEALEWLKS